MTCTGKPNLWPNLSEEKTGRHHAAEMRQPSLHSTLPFVA